MQEERDERNCVHCAMNWELFVWNHENSDESLQSKTKPHEIMKKNEEPTEPTEHVVEKSETQSLEKCQHIFPESVSLTQEWANTAGEGIW